MNFYSKLLLYLVVRRCCFRFRNHYGRRALMTNAHTCPHQAKFSTSIILLLLHFSHLPLSVINSHSHGERESLFHNIAVR